MAGTAWRAAKVTSSSRTTWKKIRTVKQGADLALGDRFECDFHIGFVADIQYNDVLLRSLGSSSQFVDLNRRKCALRVHDERNLGRVRHKFTQKLKTFRPKFGSEYADARNVSVGPVKAGNKAQSNWVTATQEHDGDGRGRSGRGDRGGPIGRNEYRHFLANQIGGKRR